MPGTRLVNAPADAAGGPPRAAPAAPAS